MPRHSLLLRHVAAAAATCLPFAAVAPHAAGAQRAAAGADATLRALQPSQRLRGFRAVALYVDDADRPIGARFVHEATRFTLDLVHQQTVPQAFVYANTFLVSDRGEPHTQEHLLVAKGSKGRALGTYESAALAGENAFTQQSRTAYNFSTAAGARAFYTLVDHELDAYLHPDYTDEEIRREVRNFGVSDDPATKSLRLEEKGSVYNEMVASSSSSGWRAFRQLGQLTYGDAHPLALSAGGTPDGIREMTPEHIRGFHRDHYHLANMGMVAAVPDEMPAADVLTRFDAMLVRLQGGAPVRVPVMTEDALPAPSPAPAGTIRVVAYPHQNAQQPGEVYFGWPANHTLAPRELTLLQLFVETFAGDATTNLYKLLVDTKTRRLDVGASCVFGFVDDGKGQPVILGVAGVAPSHMTEPEIGTVRAALLGELQRVASFADGSPELAEFNTRVRNRVVADRRALSKFVNSPPQFGARNTGSGWVDQLELVNRAPGFRKSVTLQPELRFADSLAALPTNVWRDYLTQWGLSTTTPFAVAARPDPALIAQDDSARAARAAAEVARLRASYGAADDQDAIRRYKAEYDVRSAALDSAARTAPPIRLVDDAPMTRDDLLRWRVDTVAHVPLVASTFESMTSVTTGLALRLDVVPPSELVYVASLPTLLTRVGVIENGTPVSFEAMSERLRREVLSLGASFGTNASTGRVELVVRGSGNDAAEGRRALGWMRSVLTAPNWRADNLPRIRDAVDQALTGLRTTQQGPPEAWVNGVASAYRRQDSPLYLAAASFQTRTHDVQRLRWLLKDAGTPEDRAAIDGWLSRLGAAGASVPRADVQAMLRALVDSTAPTPTRSEMADAVAAARALPSASRALAADAARDLAQSLGDVPDATLGEDWSYLTNEIRLDLLVSPATALAALDSVRARLLVAANARAFMAGSSRTRATLDPALRELMGALRAGAPRRIAYAPTRAVDARLRARTPGLRDAPIFVGLLDPNMRGGVMMNSAPLVAYTDTSRADLTRFLASQLYAGGGSHGVFSKTIASGLAYSNGVGASLSAGRLSYYAERTPELPQTLGFVVDVVKNTPADTGLVDYALVANFNDTRAAGAFEDRAESMANDLADGVLPADVRRFRQGLLRLRRTDPRLGAHLFEQRDSVYARVLPGYVPGTPHREDAVYFVIGAEKQLDAYDKYLHAKVSPDAALHRLYGRDFWTRLEAAEPRRVQP